MGQAAPVNRRTPDFDGARSASTAVRANSRPPCANSPRPALARLAAKPGPQNWIGKRSINFRLALNPPEAVAIDERCNIETCMRKRIDVYYSSSLASNDFTSTQDKASVEGMRRLAMNNVCIHVSCKARRKRQWEMSR